MTTQTKSKRAKKSEIRRIQQGAILGLTQELNCVLTKAENVPAIFHGHYANIRTGKHGAIALISEILTDKGATFEPGIEHGDLRQIAIAGSMFASEIKAEVFRRFSDDSKRHPGHSVNQFLVNGCNKGIFGKIQTFANEDEDRHCDKPRTKYYLILK